MRKAKKKITYRRFKAFCLFSILALSAFYVFQINQEVSQRYAIDEYAGKINYYSKENGRLQVSLTQTASLAKTSETIKTLGYSETGKIHYIRMMGNRVVANYQSDEKLAD